VITTYFRSSSYGAWELCNFKYYLDYILGLQSPSLYIKTYLGSATHKALELLAQRKLCEQEGISTVENEIGTFITRELNPDKCVELAFNYYKEKEQNFEWTEANFKDIRKWVWNVINFNNGMFSPLKRKVIKPEQYFDLEIEQPWANYEFPLPNGSALKGKLHLKGTIDLITEVEPNVIEVVDWKTGRRSNINTGIDKDQKSLHNDSQMLLYYYAMRRLYPEAETIFITIFYINDGGPDTLSFHKKDADRAEEMLRKRFETIKKVQVPKRIKPDWRCDKLCWFNRNNFKGDTKNICDRVYQEIQEIGLDRVTLKRSVDKTFTNYSEGGGRSNING
jgi:ATP-dependent helicase/DNAse subunit B